MNYETIIIPTSGEKFNDITKAVESALRPLAEGRSGMLNLFIPHTSCALTINESYDPAAAVDMENFLKHLAPRNLEFITHDDEGEDDSPSHMKSILLQNHLGLIVEKGEMVLGTWQGIYLCEFRDSPKQRKVLIKFQAD